jgi:tetratricopeptide (TPR) repeat protein
VRLAAALTWTGWCSARRKRPATFEEFLSTANLPASTALRICPKCGNAIPGGTEQCSCGGKPAAWQVSPETALLISLGVLFIFFTATGFFARFYHQTERSLARHWYSYGQAALAAGLPADAIQDFRTAMVYSRENGDTSGANDVYILHLAEALAAAGQHEEARAYLLALADRTPGNATVNLDLARLAARQNNVPEASRYYNAAIFGAWDTSPPERRRETRIEYAKFLLDHGEVADAQAQLIAMAAALAPDPVLHAQAGDLLLQAGENDQALAQYKEALKLDRKELGALRGAGIASFRLGDYRAAAEYFDRANRENELDDEAHRMLETSYDVANLDPFAAGLSVAERGRRTAQDFTVALERLKSCAQSQGAPLEDSAAESTSPLAQLYAQAGQEGPRATEQALRLHPDDLAPVMSLAFAMETGAVKLCGAPSAAADSALLLIARSHAGANQ